MNVTLSRDPFLLVAKISLEPISGVEPTGYVSTEVFNLTNQVIYPKDEKLELDPEYVNLNFLYRVRDLRFNFIKKDLGPKQYRELELKTNPFSKIGTSIFLNSGAIKIANLDAIFNFTEGFRGDLGSLPSRAPRRYLYVTFGDPVGALAQYIQYRKKFTLGYGMSLVTSKAFSEDKKRKLDLTKVETRGPNVYYQEWGDFEYGGDGTGNIYTNVKPLVRKLREYHVNGVDLVVGKGNIKPNIGVKNKPDEIRLFRLLVNELWGGISLLKKGGNLVVKVFSSYLKSTTQLLYLVATCFDKFYLIKPLSSPNTLDERYLVGMGLRGIEDIRSQIIALKKISKIVNKGVNKVPESILNNMIPGAFRSYVREINNYLLEEKFKALNKIENGRKYGLMTPKTEYSISRLFLGWDIPSNGR